MRALARLRQLRRVVLLVGCLCVVVVVALSAVRDGTANCSQFHFDREAWVEAGQGSDRSARDELADNLVACRVLIGRTASQVRSLLGSPDETSAAEIEEWSYALGPERRLIPMNPGYLSVRYADGRVTIAEIV